MNTQAIFIAISITLIANVSWAQQCELEKRDNFFLVKNQTQGECSFKLTHHLDRQLRFSGKNSSNINFDCQNYNVGNDRQYPSIMIKSFKTNNSWSVPSNIVLKNCKNISGFRINGMGKNVPSAYLRASAQKLGHTERAQKYAPHNIVLENLSFKSAKLNMLYLAPGVHHITLKNSHFDGTTEGVAIYLDAETGNNVIDSNIFNVQTTRREVIAIDGSAHNIIQKNKINLFSYGGIYLYRNCGEGGGIRHQTPSFNKILNNEFILQKDQKNNVIWVGSRNGGRSFCPLDAGYPFGSSIDDRDFAENNHVIGNKLKINNYKFDPKQFVIVRDLAVNTQQDNKINP